MVRKSEREGVELVVIGILLIYKHNYILEVMYNYVYLLCKRKKGKKNEII
jgi:hypothetical protein